MSRIILAARDQSLAVNSNYIRELTYMLGRTENTYATISTPDDITITTKGRGIILKNAAGTVTKRIRLNDAGDDIIIEDI
jgi:hypothetical protein